MQSVVAARLGVGQSSAVLVGVQQGAVLFRQDQGHHHGGTTHQSRLGEVWEGGGRGELGMEEGRKEGRGRQNGRQRKRKERLIRDENNDSTVALIDTDCPGDNERQSFFMNCFLIIIYSKLLTSCIN